MKFMIIAALCVVGFVASTQYQPTCTPDTKSLRIGGMKMAGC
jgi:hypothetical protein